MSQQSSCYSVVSYVGIHESGHCGYCKSSQRSKAKFGSDLEDKRVQSAILESAANDESSSYSKEEEDKHRNDSTNIDQEDLNENDIDEDEGDSVVFGLWAHRLTVQAYQCLMDRGWRRSGKYLYKPIMDKTCCPQYTIRLDIHKYRLSRTQKRVLRTMRDYLQNDKRPEKKAILREEESTRQKNKQHQMQPEKIAQKSKKKKTIANDRQPKKKDIRRKRAEERLRMRGIDIEQYKMDRAAREEARRRTLQSYFDEYLNESKQAKWKHKLEIRLVGQPSPELEEDFDEEFQLFCRYQISIHNDEPDELSPNSFRRFLASSPLMSEIGTTVKKAVDDQQIPKQNLIALGSYHQQYRLDGRIIAVGVVDILPHCMSAKYMFYDPDFAFLSLGTFTALNEISFTQQLATQRPDLHFYYMGFYLFDCPKMRYKGRFRPSDLLCDHCFDWVPLSECDRLLEQNHGQFCTFHPGHEPPKLEYTEQQLSQIKCIYAQQHMATYGKLLESTDEEDPEEREYRQGLTEKIRNYARYAGPAAFDIVLAL